MTRRQQRAAFVAACRPRIEATMTDWNYVGLLADGTCVAIATKMTDPRENARVVAEFVRSGLDVQTVRRDAMEPHYASMRAWIARKEADRPAGLPL